MSLSQAPSVPLDTMPVSNSPPLWQALAQSGTLYADTQSQNILVFNNLKPAEVIVED